METTRPAYDLNDYVAMARRHWAGVAASLLLCVAGAALLASFTTKVYVSTTSVLVQPLGGQDTNVVGGRTKGDINLDTEAQIVRSTAVAANAAALLRSQSPPDALTRAVIVEVPPNTAVLLIRYAATTPEAAQAGSHAFAEAYLQNRTDAVKADTDAQLSALDTKIKQLNSQLVDTSRRIAKTKATSPELPDLKSQRGTLVNQLNNLTNRINQLGITAVSGGKIITDAVLPTRPVKPDVPLYLGSGAAVGLLIGAALAIGRQRMDRRVRSGTDVIRRADVPVLAELPAQSAGNLAELLAPHSTPGRTFNRLRNEVLASMHADDQVIVVTGAHPGPVSTVVAANLADALARSGSEVVLVSAHAPEFGTAAISAADMFDLHDTPGLTDVLAGRATLSAALRPVPRVARLRVITTGATATASGLIQAEEVRAVLADLSRQADYLVIDAPSTATSADAQSLAGLADAVILAIELDAALYAEVTDAAEQVRRVGTPLLGAVVLPAPRESGRGGGSAAVPRPARLRQPVNNDDRTPAQGWPAGGPPPHSRAASDRVDLWAEDGRPNPDAEDGTLILDLSAPTGDAAPQAPGTGADGTLPGAAR
jgi:Mrp family chromosome partitioning ATPase/capsular polysaccharide biosynthesis protein